MFSQGQEEVKLEWMYKGPHSNVDREEYLLGRSVDKTLEQLNADEKQQQLGIQPPKNHVEHECIPPSIRDYKVQPSEQVDLAAKLQEDPLIAIKKREEENRRQFLNNPIQIKKLQKALKSQKKRKHRGSDSDDDLDTKLARKLKLLKQDPGGEKFSKKGGKKSREDNNLDTILMHKYNELKSKLSQDDLNDILQGKASDSSSDADDDNGKKSKKSGSDSSASSDNESKKNKHKRHKSRSNSREHKLKDNSKKNDYKRDTKHYSRGRRSKSRSISAERERYRSKNYINKERKQNQMHSPSNNRRKYRTKQEDDRQFRYKSGSGSRNRDRSSSSEDRSRKRANKKQRTESSDEETPKHKQDKQNSGKKYRKTSESGTELKVNHRRRSPSTSSQDSEGNPVKKIKNWGLVRADGTKLPPKRTNEASSSIRANYKAQEAKLPSSRKRTVLTEEEKERRRKEMMANAMWRDSERAKNVNHYRESQLKEDEAQKDYDPKFLQKELLKSANSSSVESRIKANINNIQRSGSDMNRNFSKR